MSELSEIHKNRVVYSLPGMESAADVLTVAYKMVGDVEWLLDVYTPRAPLDAPPPVVMFVHGDGPESDLLHAREWGQYVSYGQLMAASGLAAVTFCHRSTHALTRMDDIAEDIDDAIAFVRASAGEWGIDGDRLCIWAVSAGVPYGLNAALRELPAYVRCMVAYYGYLDLTHLQDELPHVSPDALERHSPLTYLRVHGERLPPLLIARAGQDQAEINVSIDTFVTEALRVGVSFDLFNHADGGHGFDIFEDTPRTHAVVRETIAFVKGWLTA